MRKFEDIEEYEDGFVTYTRGGYQYRWIVGVRKFNRALNDSEYTLEEICEDFEITEKLLYQKVTGDEMWLAYELDFMEEYLDLCPPNMEE